MALEPYRNETAYGDKSRAIDLDIGRVADIGDTFRRLGKQAMQSQEPRLKQEAEELAERKAFKEIDAKDENGKPIRVKATSGGSYYRERHDSITGQVFMDLGMVDHEARLDALRKESGFDVEAFGASASGYIAGVLKSVDPDLAPEYAKRLAQEARQRAAGLASEVRLKGAQARTQMLGAAIKLYRDRIGDYRKLDAESGATTPDARIGELNGKITKAYDELVAMREADPGMRALLDEADAFEIEDIALDALNDTELQEEGASIAQITNLKAGTKLFRELQTNLNHPLYKKLGEKRMVRYMQALGGHLSDLQTEETQRLRREKDAQAEADKERERNEKNSAAWMSGEVRDREALDIEFGKNIGAIDAEGNLDPAKLTSFMRRPDSGARLEPYIQKFKGQYLPPAVKNWLQGEMASGDGPRLAFAVAKYNELTGWVGPNGETYGALLKQREFTPEVNRAVRRYAMLRARGVDQMTAAQQVQPIITKEGATPVQPNAALQLYRDADPKKGAEKFQNAVVSTLAKAFNMSEDDALFAIRNDRELLATITGELDAGVSDRSITADTMDQAIGNVTRGLKGLYSYSPHIRGGVSTSNWGHNNFQAADLDRAWERGFKNGSVRLRNRNEFRGSFTDRNLSLQPPGNRPPGSAGYGEWKIWRRGRPGVPAMVIGVVNMDQFTRDAAAVRDARAARPSRIKAFVRGQ